MDTQLRSVFESFGQKDGGKLMHFRIGERGELHCPRCNGKIWIVVTVEHLATQFDWPNVDVLAGSVETMLTCHDCHFEIELQTHCSDCGVAFTSPTDIYVRVHHRKMLCSKCYLRVERLEVEPYRHVSL